MKRKAEKVEGVENKVIALNSLLKEENLEVDDIEKDVQDFLDCYDKFVKHITTIDSKEKFCVVDYAKYIIKFKELNRKAQFRLNISRDKTKESKDEVNNNHLTMQNLLYEAMHLHQETNACLEYKSLHDTIQLASKEHFLAEGPDKYKDHLAEEHELTLSRLYWELDERKRLTREIGEAEERVHQLQKEISEKEQAYQETGTNLRSVLDAALPLETLFDVPLHRSEAEEVAVEQLPGPLYVLYMQLRLFAEEGGRLSVAVITLDQEKTDNEQLAVEATLPVCQTAAAVVKALRLQFSMQSVPRLVRVRGVLEFASESILQPGDLSYTLLCPGTVGHDILDELLPPDRRGSNPGIATWCQRLAGLFLETSSPHCSISSASGDIKNLSTMLERLSTSLEARIQLAIDLHDIFNGTWEMGKMVNLHSWAIESLDNALSKCSRLAFKLESLSDEASPIVLSAIFSSSVNKELYLSSSKEQFQLKVWLLFSRKYPDVYPVVSLQQLCKDDCADSSKQDISVLLQMIEIETNCFCQELLQSTCSTSDPKPLIAKQLIRLCAGVDRLFEHIQSKSLQKLLIASRVQISRRPFHV